MQRYANRYIEADRRTGFLADPRRVVVGAIVAPAVGALATEVPTFTFESYWGIWLLGFFSVITLYLPLVLWRLRRSSRPLLTCIVVGGFSAPGLFGYALSIIGGLTVDPAFMFFPLLFTFPLGAIGGAAFWVCAVWRSEALASFSDV